MAILFHLEATVSIRADLLLILLITALKAEVLVLYILL